MDLISFINSHFITLMTDLLTDLGLTNNVSLVSSIGIEQNDVRFTDNNYLKLVITISLEQGKRMDI